MKPANCAYCRRPFDDEKIELRRTKEHIIPRALKVDGGRGSTVHVCQGCNGFRGSLTPAELRERAIAFRRQGDLAEAMADRIDELVEERGLFAPWREM